MLCLTVEWLSVSESSLLLPTTPYYSLLLPITSYYFPLLPSAPYYSLLLATTRYNSLLLPTTPYYFLLLPTTPFCSLLLPTTPFYSLLLPTTPYYSLLLPSTSYYFLLLSTTSYLLLHNTPYYSLLFPTIPYYFLLFPTREARNRANKGRMNLNKSGQMWTKPKPQTKLFFKANLPFIVFFGGIFNRSGVVEAVLQSALWFIDSFSQSVSQPFPPNIQNIINHKPEELGSWNLRECSPPTTYHMSHVACLVLCVTMSCVICHMSHIFFFFYKVLKLIGGGSLINGAYPV